jgi:uncharacterized protein (TIGR00159 family)
MDMILDVGVLAIIVIFQPEIRKFLIRLGNRSMNNAKGRAIIDTLTGKEKKHVTVSEEVNDLTQACRRMSEDKTGALIVIFQPEIRKFLIRIGNRWMKSAQGQKIFDKLFGGKKAKTSGSEASNEITEACRRMSEDKTGALIVITRTTPLDDIISTGDNIDASIHRRLIMNLFFKNSPLHDGALVISGDRIVAARCTLPITERTDIPASYGMRHKAAIGITEESDADAVIVSEETGRISFVKGGKVTPIQNINELKLLLNEALG